MDVAGESNYGDKDTMIKLVKGEFVRFDFSLDSILENRYLVGKLININCGQSEDDSVDQ
ncbi:hypothetical protein LPAF129_14230 [Ligilactobacillus pabuli]|uniref:Uncharacterized protein n=1 Tax=Ligilactobacillus pabuli TaxID=2886039 RepID=A0ABQ5JKF1_9LACO|nr:hypothetical protein LPAF129_14230 [Ligilactobacillus pabuli]